MGLGFVVLFFFFFFLPPLLFYHRTGFIITITNCDFDPTLALSAFPDDSPLLRSTLSPQRVFSTEVDRAFIITIIAITTIINIIIIFYYYILLFFNFLIIIIFRNSVS